MATGILAIVSEGELQQREQDAVATAQKEEQQHSELAENSLAGYIRGLFYQYRNYRVEESIDARIDSSLKIYNGQYTAAKRAEILKFGGSDVYSRITTSKCRGTTAMLRDIFLGNEQPWGLKPTPVPSPPPEAEANIDELMSRELAELAAQGLPPPTPDLVEARRQQLMDQAKKQMYQKVAKETEQAERHVQDILVEGRFYSALNDFLVDLPIYPMAILKGPVVQMEEQIKWNDAGQMSIEKRPKMFWYRVDPMNFYHTPGASNIEDATCIERLKMSRTDLNGLIGVPGYQEEDIRGALQDYSSGLRDWIDNYDPQYAEEQAKENPNRNRSDLIDALEFHGPVQGSMLQTFGFEREIDPDLDYYVDAWIVGNYVIKVQFNDNPSKRPIYYVSSFEKVPGAVVGHGLPEIISDIQDVANACFRSMVNNMSISSGPQVAVDEERMMPGCNPDELYPWKRWRFESDPMNNNNPMPPISFFQPRSNAQELMTIYQTMTVMADEISAIPRYMTGSQNASGAAQTASGLSMLMNNASKVLQNIAANIDHDVLRPVLTMLYDLVMLTDTTGMLRGDEEIMVQGVGVAAQRETDRMRQLEFLQMTGNPIDMEIMGTEGRATILRQLADNLGLEGASVIPGDDDLRQKEQQRQLAVQRERDAAEIQAAGAGGAANRPAPPPGAGRGPEEVNDNRMRTRGV